ncbi:MAG: FecR domain-containing protein [Prolixibacteraceae bacterium]|jgi:ferric-dicitrate binding protein FerR (iron transport regulator)|nr:FecR domain-containing protein [Prolixibacteraceae bacterium]
MENIRKYIDNPFFIKWVYDPDENVNEYWGFYLEKHPDEKKILYELKNELALFRISGQTLSEERKKILSEKIANQIREKQRSFRIRKIGQFMLKYAALAVLFMSIGAGLVYYFNQDQSGIAGFVPYFEMTEMPGKPTLVLSDGSNVNLNKTESTVDYISGNQIIVNEDSIIPVVNESSKMETIPNQLLVPYGSRAKVVLSDRSVVWLNAGSRLVYPSVFTGKQREVLLFGEAFFQVEKDESKPFIVRTADYHIRVLGTQFNVSAYPGDAISQTVLTEGSIELNINESSWFDRRVVLNPNELFSFNKEDNGTKIQKVQPEEYVLWKDGIIKFENEDLSRVVKKIERFYNIQIKLGDPLDGSIKMDGKLNLKEDKYEVLHYVSKVARRKYVEVGERHFLIE